MTPIRLFKDWYDTEVRQSTVRIPSACCLTSIGLDGYPNSRFVSLKEVVDDQFVITGPMNSRKGVELLKNPKASLTFWWPITERQVRIQGDAFPIDPEQAEAYFRDRSKASQVVSMISQQGQAIERYEDLEAQFKQLQTSYQEEGVRKPDQWGGFYIQAVRMEFMQFKESRLHHRELYSKDDGSWQKSLLAP